MAAVPSFLDLGLAAPVVVLVLVAAVAVPVFVLVVFAVVLELGPRAFPILPFLPVSVPVATSIIGMRRLYEGNGKNQQQQCVAGGVHYVLPCRVEEESPHESTLAKVLEKSLQRE